MNINLVSADPINDTFHINLQTTYSNGSVQSGTFVFAFNITENSNSTCLGPVVYNYSTSATTDARGIVSIYLPAAGNNGNLSTLGYDKQYYLCYYRDGSLKDVSQLGRVPYSFRATQVNLSEITVNSNLTLGSFNVSGTAGFFTFLGSLTNRITKFFVFDGEIGNNLSIWGNLSVGSSVLFVNKNTTGVGINTTTPQNALNVVGDANITKTLSFGSLLSGSINATYIQAGAINASHITASAINTTHILDGTIINADLTSDLNLGWANLTNYPTACGTGFAVQAVGDILTCVNVSEQGSTTLDGYDSTFFMPLNKSVVGNFSFNGGWENGGFSIVNGDIYAQTAFFYNITSLNVTQQNLTINDNLRVFGNSQLDRNLTVDTNTLFVNSNTNNVGIGTITPAQLLNVLGDANITGLLIFGTLPSASINATYISAAAINASHITAAAINTTHILDSTILTGDIAEGTILAGDIAASAINTSHILDSTILTGDISSMTILAGDISAGAINATHILPVDVNSTHLAASSVNASAITAGVVNTSHILDNTIALIDLASEINSTYARLTAANTFLGFNQTFDSDTFFIDATNNKVGIGQNSPTQELNVVGDFNATGTIISNNLNLTRAYVWVTNGTFLQTGQFNTTNTSYRTLTNGTFIGEWNITGNALINNTNVFLISQWNATNTSYLTIDRFNVTNTTYREKYNLTWVGNLNVTQNLSVDESDLFVNSNSNMVGIGYNTALNHTLSVNGDLFVGGGDLLLADAGTSNREYISINDTGWQNSGATFVFHADNALGANTFSPTAAISAEDAYIAGNVGVGTTSPAQALHINVSSAGTPQIQLSANTSLTYTILKAYDGGAPDGSAYFDIDVIPVEQNTSYVRLFRTTNTTGTAGLYIYRANAELTASHFLSANSDSYIANGSGNLGVGQDNPTNKLNVLGDANVTSTLFFGSLPSSSLNATYIQAGAINATHILPVNINSTHLAASSVNASAITAGVVNTSHILDSTILTGDISSMTILAGDISAGAINATHILPVNINSTHLAASSVNASAITAGVVNTSHILDNTIALIDLASEINSTYARLTAANTFLGFNQTFDSDTFFIDATNNKVGIGQNSPTQELNVVGDFNATGTIISNNLNLTRAYVWVTNGTFLQTGQFNTTNTSYRTLTNGTFIGEWNITGNALINNTNVFLISQWNATNTTYREKYNLTWVGNFNATSNVTLGTNRFFLDDVTGNVGVGTTSPTQTLNVVGDANATGTIYSNNLNLTRAYVWVTNGTFLQTGQWNATNSTYRTNYNLTWVGALNATGNITSLERINATEGFVVPLNATSTYGTYDVRYGSWGSSDMVSGGSTDKWINPVNFTLTGAYSSIRIMVEGGGRTSGSIGEGNPFIFYVQTRLNSTGNGIESGNVYLQQLSSATPSVKDVKLVVRNIAATGSPIPYEIWIQFGTSWQDAFPVKMTSWAGTGGKITAFSITGQPNQTSIGADYYDIYDRNYYGFAQDRFAIGTSAINPSIMLAVGDADTGLNLTTADNLSIMTVGTERIRVNNAGYVGIGQDNPQQVLNVVGDANVTSTLFFGSLASGVINTTHIVEGTLLAGDIAASAINTSHILDSTILTGDISSMTILAGDISAGAINATHILPMSINNSHIQAVAINATQIQVAAINATRIGLSEVNTSHILDLTVGTMDIGVAAINATRIAQTSVNSTHLAASSVNASAITAGVVNTSHILDNTIALIDLASEINSTYARLTAANTFLGFNQTFDSDTFFIDATNNKVGIGQNSPTQELNVVGDFNATGTVLSNNLNLTRAYVWVTNGTFLQTGQFNTTNTSYRTLTNGTFIGEWNITGNALINNTNVFLISQWNATNTSYLTIDRFNVTNTTYREKYNLTWVGNLNVTQNLTVGLGRFFVDDSSGNVGINTTAPQNTLNVVGDFNVSNTTKKTIFFINSTGAIGINTTSPNNIGMEINLAPWISGGFFNTTLESVTDAIFVVPRNKYIYFAPNADTINGNIRKLIGSNLVGDIAIGQNGTAIVKSIVLQPGGPTSGGFTALHGGNGEGLRVVNNTNVGIGTTGPNAKLDVSGVGQSIRISDTTAALNAGDIIGKFEFYKTDVSTGGAGTPAYIQSRTTDLGGLFAVDFITGSITTPITALTLLGTGNVGIGTTSPNRRLHVNQSVDTAYPTLGTAKGAFFISGDTGLYGLYTGINTNDGNTWMQAMRNDAATAYDIILQPVGGEVGIGTTSPQSQLHVIGSTTDASGILTGNSDTNDGLYLHSEATNSHYNWLIASQTNVDTGLEFTPSTATGGTTFSTPVMTLLQNGNVGIGQDTPTHTLNVVGTANFTGKVTAGSFDPPYTIDGITYATYLSGMTGIKEETTGVVQLQQSSLAIRPKANNVHNSTTTSYQYTINFNKLEKASDLWLFYQITDFGKNMENMQVILTPGFDGKVWYKKDAMKNTLTIYGSEASEVSYRLTANRFDWQNWSGNLFEEEDHPIGLLSEKR